MTFSRKHIALEFALSEGEFAPGVTTVTLDGHRVETIIEQAGHELSMASMNMRVFGMSPEMMDRFATYLYVPLVIRQDLVTVLAGDDVSGMSQVFQGTITKSAPNYGGAPDVSFDIFARAGQFEQENPAAANTFEGSTDVGEICAALAKQMGFAFQNLGVEAKLADPYLHGTLIDQLYTVVEAARIVCDINNGAITIWPNDGGLDEPPVSLSAETGLVGYPVFTRQGIIVQCEYNADIKRGKDVWLTSWVIGASGVWRVQSMRHELSTVDPNGKWFTTLQLAPPDGGFYVSKF